MTGNWSSPQWRAGATRWIDDRLAATGSARTGPVEQTRVRPWATLLRTPTTAGPVWFKAANPDTAFEAGLYRILHRVVPGRVLAPIAVDAARGWVLLPDGGPSLGERLAGPALVAALAATLPSYGQLQRDLAGHVEELLVLGVADMRPPMLPARFAEALEVAAGYVGATAEDRVVLGRLRELTGPVARWSEQLTGAPGTPSLDHNDLHPGNLLPGPVFFDWGDAVLAHPFASMLVTLDVARDRLGVDARGLALLRDAYLEPFGDLAPHAELVQTVELARRTGRIARALTWHRATRDGPPTRAPLNTLAALVSSTSG